MGEVAYVDVDGIRTRFYEAGTETGDAMLLLHGGNFGQFENVDCAENWELNWPGFAKNFRVIAMDKIGQGLTDNPPGEKAYTIDTVVSHAAGFIRTLGLTKYHLVGHSRAGYLATRLTMEYQDAVQTLTIVDSSTTVPGPNLLRGPLLAHAPRPLLSRESLEWVTRAFSFSSALLTPEWLALRSYIAQLPKNGEAVEKMRTLEERVFMPSLERSKEETLAWIRDGKLETPTLLVWGRNDPSAVLSGGLELFQILADHSSRVQMHIFNEAGHYCYREHPDEFVSVVTTFIAQNAG